MTTDVISTRAQCERLDREQIEIRLRACPCLPSLGSIESALKELLSADQRYTSQIAEIIRRDPSLTSRLLRLVNSVHYGLSKPVKSIEEAVFYLGVRQIRQLAMVTPIIEDFQNLAGNTRLAWRGFWQHCIGTALMTREIVDLVQPQKGEIDYVAGLIHDVGKIAMASAFPEHFAEIYIHRTEVENELMELEREVLGLDHAEIGAMYLQNQSLPEVFVEIVRFHHQPELAPHHGGVAAAVQVADLLVQHAQIGYSGRCPLRGQETWRESAGWKMLFAHQTKQEQALSQASLKHSLERIPATLEGLV
ncbi:MAG TPA: HDOD domain-containing protein [Candidatus Saccharimonadales bacterium]|nr:HDOD domain-containing protein [Candidatus Saccharimonadales bacterium]